jgi:hypothetical protein
VNDLPYFAEKIDFSASRRDLFQPQSRLLFEISANYCAKKQIVYTRGNCLNMLISSFYEFSST